MSLVEKIKMLCKEQKISIAELERKTGISNGQIRKWDVSTPGTDKVTLIADFFDVSLDYLLGRTDKKRYYDLTEKDERSIQEELQKMVEGLSNSGHAAFDGRTLDELSEEELEDRELLLSSLENSLRLAKRVAKQKFTPKKYRD
ncbi:transcriptional regulator [Lysinibacillus sp. B2A1]|nr:transcriptional regulator [Lysinibacillus sp. B2A1]